jgi:prepilin-type N-terminal cleavage/methylation domain-containing protein
MHATITRSASTSPSNIRFRTRGFTLVELLVVITIIVVLAALSMVGISNMRLSAAKARTTSQLRQVAVAVSLWGAEKNNGEPFYAANGTGTYPAEGAAGTNPILAPSNPGTALYNRESPDDGYLTDHTLLFSPLAKYKIPDRKDYKPDQASETKLWGTYAWYYPANVWEKLNARQIAAIGGNWAIKEINPNAAGKLLLATDYSIAKQALSKQPYLALFVDGSVREVAQTQKAWEKWLGIKRF